MRNGKKREIVIDKEKNECQVQMIEYVLNKNKCEEIFLNFEKLLSEDSDEEQEIKDNILGVKKKFGMNLRK